MRSFASTLEHLVLGILLGVVAVVMFLTITGADQATVTACKIANDNQFGETACIITNSL